MSTSSSGAASVRPPAVAGRFYPRQATALRDEVTRLLAAAQGSWPVRPKALVVPHAGYVYSGPTAAAAYARLRASGPALERVVLLGPSHDVPLAGLALPEADTLLTPLGALPVDPAAARRALALPQVTRSAAAHAREHSLEVQLPFLQVVLGEPGLVPLVVGFATPAEVAEVLEALWGGPETLLVVSTDLSHYLSYDEARRLDGRTARQVVALDAEGLDSEQACGCTPLRGLLLAARRRQLSVEQVDLRSSGDTAGDRDRVVGYGAFALYDREDQGTGRRLPGAAPGPAPGPGSTSHRHRAGVVTGLARAALAALFGGPPPLRPAGEGWLEEPRACFVSLHRRGELRGCIGSLEPRETLFDEVCRCARSAATEDHRFEPLSAAELPELELDVSVLSPLEPLPAADEAEALRRLRPGVDGLVLSAAGRRATFIPAMWEQLPDPRAFLHHLRRKAGLPDGWLPDTRLQRFTADLYREERP